MRVWVRDALLVRGPQLLVEFEHTAVRHPVMPGGVYPPNQGAHVVGAGDAGQEGGRRRRAERP